MGLGADRKLTSVPLGDQGVPAGKAGQVLCISLSATRCHHWSRTRFSWISGTIKSFPRKGAWEPQLRIKAGLGVSDMHWLIPEQLLMSTVCFEELGRMLRQSLLLFPFVNTEAEAP